MPDVDDVQLCLLPLRQRACQVHDRGIQGVSFPIEGVWSHGSENPLGLSSRHWLHHPDRARTLAHQVHGRAAEQHLFQPQRPLGGHHHQVVPLAQHLAGNLDERSSDQDRGLGLGLDAIVTGFGSPSSLVEDDRVAVYQDFDGRTHHAGRADADVEDCVRPEGFRPCS